jgi:hypothetical protein
MRMDRFAPVLIATVVAVPLAACGSGSDGGGGGAESQQTSAASYVHQICQSISGFESNVTAGESKLNAQSSGASPNLAKLKTTITAFFSSAGKASATAKVQIDKAGTPAVAKGPKIRDALLSAFQKFSDSFNSAATQSKTLDPTNQTQFQAETLKLQQQLRTTSQGVSATLNGLGNSLDAAAKEDSACAAIEGGSN